MRPLAVASLVTVAFDPHVLLARVNSVNNDRDAVPFGSPALWIFITLWSGKCR